MTNKAHHEKIAAAVVAVATAVAANAETYHVKRGGMENARFDLKADKAGYYHRDNVYSNVRGQVIVGKLTEKWFEAEHGATADPGAAGGSGESSVPTTAPKPTFSVRFDDNKWQPSRWREIAAVFERHGFRCTIAANAATLSEEQGACLRELAARGHEIADHTPNHSICMTVYPDQASFERASRLPFVHDADPKTRKVFFDWEADDAHPSNVTFRASVVDGALVPAGAYAGKKPPTRFFKLPGRDGVFGYKEESGRLMLRDFWKRAPAETMQMEEGDVLGYSVWALQPCDGLLRELASLTRERFDHFGIPRPTIWAFPGGWCGSLRQDAMERVYGRGFGYAATEAGLGPVKRGCGRWYAAFSDSEFFDGDSPADPDALAAKIAAKLESGRTHVTLSHMWTKDFPGYLERTDRFLQRLEERGVNVVTVGESVEARFGGGSGKDAKKPFPVALTFDDNAKELWTIAAPMLVEFGYPATFNVITGGLGKWDPSLRLTWDDVRGLVRAGFDIATHTRSHTPLTKLLQEGKTEQLRSEVVDSAAEIERETGYHVTLVCLPGNYWSPEIDREVKALGFGVQEWRRPGIGGGEGVTKTPREQAKAAIEKAMADGRGQCALMFHGIDKMGWRPLPRGAEDLRDVFELLREMERAGTIRVVSYDEAFSARN